MNKALVALALISVLAMVIIGGCAKPPAQAAPSTGEQAVNNTITGQIQEVDKLNSELTDPGLEDIDSQLDDINW